MGLHKGQMAYSFKQYHKSKDVRRRIAEEETALNEAAAIREELERIPKSLPALRMQRPEADPEAEFLTETQNREYRVWVIVEEYDPATGESEDLSGLNIGEHAFASADCTEATEVARLLVEYGQEEFVASLPIEGAA